MRLRDLPNLISVVRIFLSLPVVWCMVKGRFDIALLLFAVAGISDGLDGFLAKRFGWESRLGGLLDPLADKVLLISAFLSLGWLGFLPISLVLLVILRDLLIVTGALVYHYSVAELDARPSWLSKLNTAVQILLVLAVVSSKGLTPAPDWVITGLIVSTYVTTFVSGVDYVWKWSHLAMEKGRRED